MKFNGPASGNEDDGWTEMLIPLLFDPFGILLGVLVGLGILALWMMKSLADFVLRIARPLPG